MPYNKQNLKALGLIETDKKTLDDWKRSFGKIAGWIVFDALCPGEWEKPELWKKKK